MFENYEYPSIKFWKLADDVYYVDQNESITLFTQVRKDVMAFMKNESIGHSQLDIRKKRFSKAPEMRILQLD